MQSESELSFKNLINFFINSSLHRHLLYSMIDEEKGKDAGLVQTLFLKVKQD